MIRAFVFLLVAALLIHAAPIESNEAKAAAKKFVSNLVANVRDKNMDAAFDTVFNKLMELTTGLFTEKEIEINRKTFYLMKELPKRGLNTSTEELDQIIREGAALEKEGDVMRKAKIDSLSGEGKKFVNESMDYINALGLYNFKLEMVAPRQLIGAISKIDTKFDKLSEPARTDLIKQFEFLGKLKEMKEIAIEVQKVDWKKIAKKEDFIPKLN